MSLDDKTELVEGLTIDQVAWVIERTCTSIPRYDDPRRARAAAWRCRHMTLRVMRPYRCPFDSDDDEHWHVGHVASVTALHRLAAAVRGVQGATDSSPAAA